MWIVTCVAFSAAIKIDRSASISKMRKDIKFDAQRDEELNHKTKI